MVRNNCKGDNDDFAGTVDMNSPLSKAIEVFSKTKFAFVPITGQDDTSGNSEVEVITYAHLFIY